MFFTLIFTIHLLLIFLFNHFQLKGFLLSFSLSRKTLPSQCLLSYFTHFLIKIRLIVSSLLKENILSWFVTVVRTQTVLHLCVSRLYEEWYVGWKRCLNPVSCVHVKRFALGKMLRTVNWRIHVSSCVHIVTSDFHWLVSAKRNRRLSVYNKLWLFQLIEFLHAFFWLI